MTKELDVHVLKSHTGAVNAVSFFDNDKKFVSAGDDSCLIGWSVDDKRCIFKLKGHEAPVKACSASLSGLKIVSGSWDRTVRIWDGCSTNCLWTLQHEALVLGVSFSEETSLITVCCDDKSTKVWDMRTYENVMTFTGHSNSVTCCAQNEFTVATGSLDKTIRLSDMRTGSTLLLLTGHTSAVSAVDISSDGFKLCSGSWDKTVRVWDVHAGTYRTQGPKVMYEHEGCVSSCKFAVDNKKIVSGGFDKTVIIWDALATKKRHKIRAHGSWINDIAMTAEGKWLLSCSKDRTIRMWNVENADKMPVVLHNKLSMGYKFQECVDCQRTFKVEKRDLIEVGEEYIRCVYCRMPTRSYHRLSEHDLAISATETDSEIKSIDKSEIGLETKVEA